MQCELLGVTGREQVLQLAEQLTGLSGRPGKKHTLGDQAVTNDSWEVCHEGLIVRGKGFADLPAVVRSRTTAACQGRHSLSFWKHLGFSVSYELVKKGFSYTVYYDDFELEARAAHAIGAFSKYLEPLVELRKSSA
ncbi:hypothetical protein WJX82_001753 [Trebouxia sp. C0006]